MEAFNGDRLLQDDGAAVFPDQLSLFPDLLYHPHQLPPPSPVYFPDEEGGMNGDPLRCHNLPPQKLRPIRYTGRSPAGSQFPTAGALSGYHSTASPIEFECRGEDSGKQPSRDSEGRVEEHEPSQTTSFSSDGGDESFTITREPENRKRKRRSESKLQLGLMKILVMKLMERQEQMHKELMGTIESQERERISREEAWQRVVMEKMKRNEELRTEETSRSLALISYIHKILGQDIPKPEPLTVIRPAERQGETETPPNKDAYCYLLNKRWLEKEVQALISLRTALNHKFHATGPKGSAWEEISISMSSMGYKRSARKCKEKWENINKYFKRTKEKGKNQPENGKTRPYFKDLDIVYRAGLLNSGKVPDVPNCKGGQELTSTRELQSGLDSSDHINKRSAEECKEEWENIINKYFKRTTEKGKKLPELLNAGKVPDVPNCKGGQETVPTT